MNQNVKFTKNDIVVSEDDIAAIDPNMRRNEIEKQIGKSRCDAFFLALVAMRQHGDDANVASDIFHYSYFRSIRRARQFGKWLTAEGYKLHDLWTVRKSRVRVDFSHTGQTTLNSMTEHENSLSRMAENHGGIYDGWETSVEHPPKPRLDQ